MTGARWRVSDVFAAIASDASASADRRDAAWWAWAWATQDSGFELTDATVGKWLRTHEAGIAVGCDWVEWRYMTGAQRCAAVVREARRLGVPRRAA